MYNFLNSKLKPSVQCNVISEEGHPPENLIKENGDGFIAYSVIKPPVDLTFEFICPVNVHFVKIWPQIGSLKSITFEVYGKSDSTKEFIKLSQGNIQHESGIVFDISESSNQHNFKMCTFFPRTRYLMKKLQYIKICITQTLQRCAVVLRKIEIWGYPYDKCAGGVIEKIDKLWNQFEYFSSPKKTTLQSEAKSTPKLEHGITAPEDFYDIITQEIMTIPMVLPSGKTVDLSTIERHSRVEETWGRMPSDPFTGILYKIDKKPVLNLVLKSQIEAFLLKHSSHSEFKNVPRTVATTREKRLADEIYSMPTLKKLKSHKTETIVSAGGLSSLDLAVENALSRITTKFTERPKPIENRLYCFNCKNVDNIYKITKCSHFICWNCLTNQVKLTTCNCGIYFTKTDIIKFHKTTL